MKIDNLHKAWVTLAQKYCQDKNLVDFYWEKIYKKYSEKSRYYHNLIHISSMLDLAGENQSEIINYDELLFAIWFHDIIYKSTSKKNEEKSAEFAKSTLIKLPKKTINIDVVSELIISTKSHQIILHENNDNAFLLDFDLSILGSDWNIYKTYIKDIRKEYKIYPDFLYNPTRKKVLENFLNREHLFFTKKYQDLFEKKARKNLELEIKLLS